MCEREREREKSVCVERVYILKPVDFKLMATWRHNVHSQKTWILSAICLLLLLFPFFRGRK